MQIYANVLCTIQYTKIYKFFDLVNTVSYPDEVKQMLLENTTYANSNLEHNHQGLEFLIKRHEMDAPKSQISMDASEQFHKELVKLS